MTGVANSVSTSAIMTLLVCMFLLTDSTILLQLDVTVSLVTFDDGTELLR